MDHRHAAVSASYGSWNTARVTGDIGGPIDSTLSVRLIGAIEDRNSFRDHVGADCRLIAPSIAWQPTSGLRLLHQAEYMRNSAVLDRGIVGIAGNARAMDRSTFVGEPGDGRIVQKILWQQASAFADLGSGIGLEIGGSHRDGSLRCFGTMVNFGGRGLQPDNRTAGRDRRYHDLSWNDLTLRAELTATVELSGLSTICASASTGSAMRWTSDWTGCAAPPPDPRWSSTCSHRPAGKRCRRRRQR